MLTDTKLDDGWVTKLYGEMVEDDDVAGDFGDRERNSTDDKLNNIEFCIYGH